MYKYIGEIEIEISGIGLVKPGQVVESKSEINHPLFVEEVKKAVKGKK